MNKLKAKKLKNKLKVVVAIYMKKKTKYICLYLETAAKAHQ